MSAALTREQTDLRDAVADLMAKRSPEQQVRRLMAGDTGHDPAVWTDMAAMGLLGLTIPEEFPPSTNSNRRSSSRSATRCGR
jgi:acyl-CoA dehydrogenase